MKYRGRVISAIPPVANTSQASGIWFPTQHMQGTRAGTWPVDPSSAYIGTKLFSASTQYNNSTSTRIVPANVTFIWYKIWGSGGAPDGYSNGFPGGDGGGGGFTQGVITCTPGETLNIAVGTVTNNGGASKSFGGSGGGFSGVFRSGSSRLIAGGGGGGQVNNTGAGGAGGGSSGQASSDGIAGGTQSAAGPNGSSLVGGSEGGGGGYFGGGGGSWSSGSGGGSGFTGGSIAKTSTTTGNYRTPAGTSDPEYPSGSSPGGLPWAYGGIGNNSGDSSAHGSGYIIAHCYSINPVDFPYPTNRILL